MTFRHRISRCVPLLVLMLLPGIALGTPPGPELAPTASDTPRVTVTYHEPHQFTESRLAGFGHGYDHDQYLQKLQAFLVRRATPMLKPHQHLSITVTDIKLAGNYEPWHGPNWDNVRFMRDIYPPRIHLRFTLTGTDGQVLRQGSRKLIGLDYLNAYALAPGDTDPLRYDKALLDRWLRRGPSRW